MIKALRAKFHRIRVTGADLNYHGSISLDPEQCALVGLLPMEFVEIWNKNSGARISTYVIYGEPGSKCCILNGAAARTCQAGDEVIIAASEYTTPDKLPSLAPKVATFTDGNEIDSLLRYDVEAGGPHGYSFKVTALIGEAPAQFADLP